MKIQENTPNTGGHEVTRSKESNYSGKALKSGVVILTILVICIGWYLGAHTGKIDAEGGPVEKSQETQALPLLVSPPIITATGETAARDGLDKDGKNRQSAGATDSLTPEQRAERLIQKIKALADEYHALQQQLFHEHPELPGLREYVLNRPGELNEGINHLIDELTLSLKDKQFEKAWAELRALRRPWELLAALDDPLFATYFRDVWENAGINKAVSDWIRDTDRLAGVTPLPSEHSLSFTELRGILEDRLHSYQRAADSVAQKVNIPGQLRQILEPTEYFKIQVAEWYVESFYSGRLEQIRRESNRHADDLGQIYNRHQSEEMQALMKQFSSIKLPDIGKK